MNPSIVQFSQKMDLRLFSFKATKYHSAKHFVACKFFRIAMFSWWFSWFYGTVNVYWCFLTLNILFDEVDRGLRHEKEKFIWYHLYCFFFKSAYGWLVVTLVGNKYCKGKDDYA